MRVAQIKTVKYHPDADSLYVEEMDTGEETYRTVVTGVVKFIPIEQVRILACLLSFVFFEPFWFMLTRKKK